MPEVEEVVEPGVGPALREQLPGVADHDEGDHDEGDQSIFALSYQGSRCFFAGTLGAEATVVVGVAWPTPRLTGMAVDAAPPHRQRVAAYALLTRDDEVLLTRMSPRTRIEGRWTLPGGGIDHGEDPRDALRREVYEETGLHVEPGRVIDVHTTHFVGARADGEVEDYHGIHLIFDADIAAESRDVEPRVIEEDSSTDRAAWVPLRAATELDLLSAARHALTMAVQEG